ncbi:BRO family protein [Rhodococcus sp. ACT016]|uniref:BRO-N domain-containing protein n=1 Tax=Rhodococcus sp. ACT016 TaxID=3134808 RepID=UPI003D27A03B
MSGSAALDRITPFHYGTERVRVLDIDGEPWFVLSDLTKVLGLRQYRTDRLDDGVIRNHPIVDGLGRTQNATIVSETGMYEVVIRSDKPEAARFRKWITAEVLPSIRRTGSYGAAPALTEDEIVAQALAITTHKVETLTAKVAELEPKADFYDELMEADGTYSLLAVAKILGWGRQSMAGSARMEDENPRARGPGAARNGVPAPRHCIR